MKKQWEANDFRKGTLPKLSMNKAKAISAELLELNLKNKLEETGKKR